MFAFLKHLLSESEIFGNINFLKYFYTFLIYKNLWFFDLYSLTVADTLASSYVHSTSSTVCDAAELAPICVKGVRFFI